MFVKIGNLRLDKEMIEGYEQYVEIKKSLWRKAEFLYSIEITLKNGDLFEYQSSDECEIESYIERLDKIFHTR